ncbi:hypothetical protein Zmor_007491 [Zophobas morio]|uniref:Gustatory receptor n=1 Tax=Zophobas morio TaxID=2755281 RepID=A0AA38MNR6_9CUCU|nr:hypothetical protein Zmor_007491 [Zophobas morio]
MINDLLQFGVKLTAKEFFLVCELLISTSTIIVNILCLLRSHTNIQESHGLISLIDKKVVFEVTEVLSASSAGKIYDLLLLFILILALHEVAILFRIVITEELDFVLVVRIFATEIILLCNVSLALYFAQFLTLYDITFENCYEELRKCVQSKAHARLVTKLKKLQRFYMCLRRNFKLNERFVRSGIVITYAINVCLVLIMFSYFVVLQAEQELDLTTLDFYLAGKSMALIGMFFVGCYDAQRILNKAQNTLLSLFQCSTTKLKSEEAAQIESIIQTLSVLKPDLNASYIFTADMGLIASICGTVLTHVLVALQFRALLSRD